ncbi:MAG: methylated-DNA--[protein]-cysteine S-methyltransferase [Hydrogenophaga sp.]|uniref:methylated-DNA--[protein]-cysteine S-methyltransferase n=1 Tax=Hydrogenophaga sp. TaxID=1904254 RepID=UPI002728F31A|nr:methylated-DNA--[protein]-cysteine S-methyltransferase [Hydrogenophaga sp.]MDO9568521.1 methylated-DNA--[protein]-cysteine S-methyltransferase [Hydrogenophaga sp.]MDP3376271.1 methylated-DNA--[protein]-cysteine S-methyltransferase [Hydrogenophaga sp.]
MKHGLNWVKTTVDSPLGPLLLAASAHGLAGVWFTNQRHLPADSLVQSWPADARHPVLQAAAQQLTRYCAGNLNAFDLPLDLSGGTPFQQSVWQALLSIPAGQTRRYGELASQIGRPAAVRAVGAAIGRNPLSIVVPCHRVVGADGSLTGYAGGLDRKAALLERERSSGPL